MGSRSSSLREEWRPSCCRVPETGLQIGSEFNPPEEKWVIASLKQLVVQLFVYPGSGRALVEWVKNLVRSSLLERYSWIRNWNSDFCLHQMSESRALKPLSQDCFSRQCHSLSDDRYTDSGN